MKQHAFFRKKKRIILICVIIAALLAAVGVKGNLTSLRAKTATTVTMEATAKSGEITSTIQTSGTLSAQTTDEVTIPEGTFVKELKVSAGDTVSEGDVLATVKKGSVASALLSVNERVEELEDQIDDLGTVSDKTSDKYLKRSMYQYELDSLKDLQSRLKKMFEKGKI